MTIEERALELETRRKIYHFVLKHPGLHFRKISRKLNVNRGTLEYHLKYLEKRGLLTVESRGNYTIYFISNNIGNYQKKMLHLLHQEVPRNIILYFLTYSCASQIELSKELEKHPTTIESHLKKLLNMNIIEQAPVSNIGVHVEFGILKIIERFPVGSEKIYRLKNPYSIYDSVILYKKRSLDDNFCGDLIYIFKSMDRRFSKLGRTSRKYWRSSQDSFEEEFFKVFPHPYHV